MRGNTCTFADIKILPQNFVCHFETGPKNDFPGPN